MKLPERCPVCNRKSMWIVRAELDFDSDAPDRIEDEIYECNWCHTLFRARWKLVSFKRLVEVDVDVTI